MTSTRLWRSRVKGNFHARFCSSGEESDFLTDCNRIAARWRIGMNINGFVWAAAAEASR